MELQEQIPLLVVAGPTASGKTALAVALAKQFDGEVVSADSMQIYREMNIATAKPTLEEMDGIPHHLIDFLEPDAPAFSVADYARLARQTIEKIAAGGRLPILAGGTGLYIQAVTDHLQFSEMPSDLALRQQLREQAAREGSEAMHALLRECDPVLAEKLHPNNLERILRAIEVCQSTGLSMSEHQRRSRLQPAPYRLCMLGLDFADRALLYRRIDCRVDQMLQEGLLAEARQVAARYGGTARQAIGYKELEPFLRGEAPLEVCVEKLKQATRHYAKRQLCWFRRDERLQWFFRDRVENPHELFIQAQILVHKSGVI